MVSTVEGSSCPFPLRKKCTARTSTPPAAASGSGSVCALLSTAAIMHWSDKQRPQRPHAAPPSPPTPPLSRQCGPNRLGLWSIGSHQYGPDRLGAVFHKYTMCHSGADLEGLDSWCPAHLIVQDCGVQRCGAADKPSERSQSKRVETRPSPKAQLAAEQRMAWLSSNVLRGERGRLAARSAAGLLAEVGARGERRTARSPDCRLAPG